MLPFSLCSLWNSVHTDVPLTAYWSHIPHLRRHGDCPQQASQGYRLTRPLQVQIQASTDPDQTLTCQNWNQNRIKLTIKYTLASPNKSSCIALKIWTLSGLLWNYLQTRPNNDNETLRGQLGAMFRVTD